jgi:hypothetical protein
MRTRVDLEMKRGVNELGVQVVQGSPVEGIYAGSANKITREARIGTGTRGGTKNANDLAVQVRFEIPTPTQGRQES